MTGTDEAGAFLAARWYVQVNDLIGGWCVTIVDARPSAGAIRVADFLSEPVAEHIVDLHNAALGDIIAAVAAAALAQPTRTVIVPDRRSGHVLVEECEPTLPLVKGPPLRRAARRPKRGRADPTTEGEVSR